MHAYMLKHLVNKLTVWFPVPRAGPVLGGLLPVAPFLLPPLPVAAAGTGGPANNKNKTCFRIQKLLSTLG